MHAHAQTQKPVSEFYRSKANADGYDGRCKACDAIQCSERRKKKPRIENPTVDRKVRANSRGSPVHQHSHASMILKEGRTAEDMAGLRVAASCFVAAADRLYRMK